MQRASYSISDELQRDRASRNHLTDHAWRLWAEPGPEGGSPVTAATVAAQSRQVPARDVCRRPLRAVAHRAAPRPVILPAPAHHPQSQSVWEPSQLAV